jgi:hypothetical protein
MRHTPRASTASPGVPVERPLPVPARVVLLVVLASGLVLPVADLFSILFFVTHALVGYLLVIRRPRNPIGWLLIAIAFGFVGTGSLDERELVALSTGTAPLPAVVRAWIASWAGSAAFAAYIALAALYPTGTFGQGRQRRVGQVLVGLALAAVVLAALTPTIRIDPDETAVVYDIANPIGIAPDVLGAVGLTSDWWAVVSVGLLLASVVALVIRYRASTGIVRVQMRWLVASLCAIVVSVIVGFVLTALGGAVADLAWLPVLVVYPTLPVSVYVAVTRYRLYEFDRIVSRSVAWAVVSALLLGLFAVGLVALQALLAGITQGQALAVAASTLLAFGLFQPLRYRVQRVVDRRFDRARYDAERTAGAFAERLRGEIELVAVRDELVATVIDALRPTGVGIWMRESK